jgi:hypothetical protein
LRAGLLAFALLPLTACAERPDPVTSNAPPAPLHFDGTAIRAVLLAGDSSIPAFDAATSHVADLLAEAGTTGTTRLSARRPLPAGVAAATPGNLLDRVPGLKPGPGGGCFVFLTSHGVPGRGLEIGAGDVLEPASLDRALSEGCDPAPTVVIVSACFSGQFAAAPMTRPNRIILAASGPGRGSFGCLSGVAYTYYDECLIGALRDAADWQVVHRRVQACVGRREEGIGIAASGPEAFFGAAVTALPTPWPPSDQPQSIVWKPAPKPFDPGAVPFGGIARHQQAGELARYAKAPKPKAMALTPEGFLTMVDGRGGGRGPDDVARLALERCEFVTGGACILFARDQAMVAPMPSGLLPFHPEILARDGAVTAARVPFIEPGARPHIDAYLALPGPKALALSPTRGAFAAGTGTTAAAARGMALEECRLSAADCVIFAEGDRIDPDWAK